MAYQIAIVGAGTAGLAASIFLKRDGHDVTIYERFPSARPVGAGLLLQPTGLAVLAALGLDQAAIQAAAPIWHLHGVSGTGRLVFDMHYSDLAPHLHGLGIHRGVLFGLLHRAALACGAQLQTSSCIAAVDRSGPRPVVIDEDGECHGSFDLVIDAAGSRSALRLAHADTKFNVHTRSARFGAFAGIPNTFSHATRWRNAIAPPGAWQACCRSASWTGMTCSRLRCSGACRLPPTLIGAPRA